MARWSIMLLLAALLSATCIHAARLIPSEHKNVVAPGATGLEDEKNFVTYGGIGGASGLGSIGGYPVLGGGVGGGGGVAGLGGGVGGLGGIGGGVGVTPGIGGLGGGVGGVPGGLGGLGGGAGGLGGGSGAGCVGGIPGVHSVSSP